MSETTYTCDHCGKETNILFGQCQHCKTFGKCTGCDSAVEVAKWSCLTGEQHVVKPHRYYKDDAPQDGGYSKGPGGSLLPSGQNLKDSRTMVCNLVPERREQHGHEVHNVPGRNVEFIRGMYTTTDPEEQYYLDKHITKGKCCTPERWAEVYFTHEQKMMMDKQRMEEQIRRIEKERNELLAQVKGNKKSA